MRSRTGCLTCRQRKLKCDETRPICGQCNKASRECIPSSGIVFRHQHNASMNGDDSLTEGSLKAFYAYKNTFDDDTIWLDIPKHVTFINTTNPYLDPCTPDFETMSTASMESPAPFQPRPLASWRMHNDHRSPAGAPLNTGPDLHPTSIPNCFIPELEALPPLLWSPSASTVGTPSSPPTSIQHHRLNPNVEYSVTPPPIDPNLNTSFESSAQQMLRSTSAASSLQSSSQASQDGFTESNQEIAFLLKCFSDGPGFWMDLFDMGTYFASHVPIKARETPLLKYAAVACAAKSLACAQGRDTIMGGNSTHLIDWKHKAAVYYDHAVSLLLQALKTGSTSTPEYESPHQDARATKRCKLPGRSAALGDIDNMLAASAILCEYEFLDTSVSEWDKHLNGAKSLFMMSQEQRIPWQMPSPGSSILSMTQGFQTKARRATFWNIARQDLLAAFINNTHTRLNPDDFTIWREAGLPIDDHGHINTGGLPQVSSHTNEYSSKEDTICNALVWLMAKMINFIAMGNPTADNASVRWNGLPYRTVQAYWNDLQAQFQAWFESLPLTFQPSARVQPSYDANRLAKSGSLPIDFVEIWYSIPMCASTMQAYHMSQILLLMNKPQESTYCSSTIRARIHSYQATLAACQQHSREIVGISLAGADDAVRIHSVQPLFTAGQCFREARERQTILDLLRNIEADIGWGTDYRVRQLLQQWHDGQQADSFVT